MTDFGDADPEDGYDVNDPPEVRYRVLLLWVASVALEHARGDHDHVRVLARIQQARWAAGVLLANLSARRARIVAALQEWLDDLLEDEGD